jgi:sensor histidine kinase regulating citrate/malate metabolism
MGIHQGALREFQTCIRELFQNIEDHSTEEIGCMHVQWHPNVRRVKIAISDFGIGIPAEVRKVTSVPNDAAAIAKAVQDGFSSKGGKNRGAGLSYLVDNVAGRNRGWLGIYSGNGHMAFDGPFSRKAALMEGAYPGTLVNMNLRTDTISTDADEGEDLSW